MKGTERLAFVLVIISTAVILYAKLAGPSDLYHKHQPRTASYTIDMVTNGRWILPMDMLGEYATKPPLVNWLGVPLASAGIYSDWAFKLPSVVAGLLTMLLIAVMASVIAGRWLGLLAPSLWLVCPRDFSLITQLRPDMLLVMCLTAAWVSGSLLLLHSRTGGELPYRRVYQWLLWLGVAGAIMTKGPPALLALIYIIIGSRVIAGRWGAIHHTGISWGLPLAIGLVLLWAVPAYLANPQHFHDTFIGNEIVNRVAGSQVMAGDQAEAPGLNMFMRLFVDLWRMPKYFLVGFLPWSFFVIMSIWHGLPRRFGGQDAGFFRYDQPLAPAYLWVVICIVFFSLSVGKIGHYISPAFPAAACIAGYWLFVQSPVWLRKYPIAVFAIVFVTAIGMGVNHRLTSHAAKSQLGENEREFVEQVRMITGGEHLVFRRTGYNAVQPRLGYNQPQGDPAADESAASNWLIQPIDLEPWREPLAVSEVIISVHGDELNGRLGLYRN